MAEVTALRNNCLPYPMTGFAYGIVFPILDADGDLVTGATGLDSEVSLNGDTFADCTNEATEIATSSGMYYLLLTAAEVSGDVITIIVKTSTSGAKTTPLVLYPRKLVKVSDFTIASDSIAGTLINFDSTASAIDDYYNGMIVTALLDSTLESRMITDYNGSLKSATVSPAFTVLPDTTDLASVYLPENTRFMLADVKAFGSIAGTFSAGIPAVNTTQISGDSTAADNLESYTDGSEFMPVDAHAQDFAVTGTGPVLLTTKKPDGTTNTAYSPKTVTTDAVAIPITGVS